MQAENPLFAVFLRCFICLIFGTEMLFLGKCIGINFAKHN